jgi:hypothetical protein
MTTTVPTTTTTIYHGSEGRFPDKVVGLYIILADDTEEGFHTDSDWDPKLFEYQQTGANVLFFTFINPGLLSYLFWLQEKGFLIQWFTSFSGEQTTKNVSLLREEHVVHGADFGNHGFNIISL